jgi:hypothetical protein
VSEHGATSNEHALHVGRWVLRFPGRYSAAAVSAWRLSVPRLLTGWLPSREQAQRMMHLIKQGKLDTVRQQVAALDASINAAAEERRS